MSSRLNRTYNLTRSAPSEMLTHHLLDSSPFSATFRARASQTWVRERGFRACPGSVQSRGHFTLIDSTARKSASFACAQR